MDRMESSSKNRDEARARAAETRKRQSRHIILEMAEGLVEAGEFSVTMKDFARRAGVSVNTVKRQFASMEEVFAAVADERAAAGRAVPRRLQTGKGYAAARDSREYVTNQVRVLRSLADVNISQSVEATRSIYADCVATHPEENYLLATTCCYLSYRLLQLPKDPSTTLEARQVAERGLEHLDADRSRHYALGAQLARIAADAARRLAQAASDAVGPEPDELRFLRATRDVVAHLHALAENKRKESVFEKKLNQPLTAAAAEYHRARAQALIQDDVPAEIDAALAMARTLVDSANAGKTLPPRILIPFVTRLCGTQLAYRQILQDNGDDEELTELRDRLLDNLRAQDSTEAATASRGLATMITLVDRNSGDIASASALHLPDLILLTGYGVVGQVLLADFLRDIADVIDSRPAEIGALYPSTALFNVTPSDLRPAAMEYYRTAQRFALVVGSAAVLANRARQARQEMIERLEPEDSEQPKPWAVLHQGKLNTALVNQLSLGMVTGRRPTASEASEMLRELEPFLDTLRTVAGIRAATVEKIQPTEDVYLTSLRFD